MYRKLIFIIKIGIEVFCMEFFVKNYIKMGKFL